MRIATAALLALAACGARSTAPSAGTLGDTAGGTIAIPGDFARSKLTVLVFYAEHCPCFRVHEARLRELASAYADRGVRLIFVDSEVSANKERDAKEAAERGLPPIALDPGGALADSVGADYATYTVVFDTDGRIRFRGGIDSDKERLHDDATPYLRNALDDLLGGHEPRLAEAKVLGCALQKR